MLSNKRSIKLSPNFMLTQLACGIRKRISDPKAGGFPGYVNKATDIGMDVNDWEEEILGWDKALPILQQTTFPYVRADSMVCNLGVGTGRWARHIAPKLLEGELHLVDHSPWIVKFVQRYFKSNPRVHVHLNDGYSLPWQEVYLDIVFSAGTFIALKLGHIYLYCREIFKALKPSGYCVVEYIDVTVPEGWKWLESQTNKKFADCYTYYAPQVMERVFLSVGFEIVTRHQIARSVFLVVRKPSMNRVNAG